MYFLLSFHFDPSDHLMAELDFPPTFLLSKITFQLTIRYQTKYTVWCQKWCTSLTAFFSGLKHHLSADERPKHVGKATLIKIPVYVWS